MDSYDEQIKGAVEELLEQVMKRELKLEDVQKKLLELNRKIDEEQEIERGVETKFLADLQELTNNLNYSDDPEIRDLARKLKLIIYEHRMRYAEIRRLEEEIG